MAFEGIKELLSSLVLKGVKVIIEINISNFDAMNLKLKTPDLGGRIELSM